MTTLPRLCALSVLAALALAGPGLATTEETEGRLVGRLENGRYHAPCGLFTVPVPALSGFQAEIIDNEEVVVFRDTVGTLLTIACFKMPLDQKWEYETSTPRDYAMHFFREFILPDLAMHFPGSRIESARFLHDVRGGALLVYTLMPGGSAFELDPLLRALPDAPTPVAKRGNLIFVYSDHVFVLSTELAERVTQHATYALSPEQEDQRLRARLLETVEKMEFFPPPAKPR
jgi:hypothetical protein